MTNPSSPRLREILRSEPPRGQVQLLTGLEQVEAVGQPGSFEGSAKSVTALREVRPVLEVKGYHVAGREDPGRLGSRIAGQREIGVTEQGGLRAAGEQ